MAEYFCPNCGAVLNRQEGFSPFALTWICTECGMLLMDEETYEGEIYNGVAWYCDACGDLLNTQDGFSDIKGYWRCKRCGCINGTTEADIINSDPHAIWPLS